LNRCGVTASKPLPGPEEPGAPDEGALVAACRRGDREAFGHLVTRYRGKVYSIIYHMVRNEEDAWDLAQDAFLRAWKSIGHFRGQSSFYTWLYRIVMNVAIDWLRRKHVAGSTEFDEEAGVGAAEPGALTVPSAPLLPHRQLEAGEIRERIDAALARLSPEHRAVITLKEFEGLHYQEIADTVGCSLGTVMSRLFYARKKLQSLLRDVYEEL
jgi:RNA polymerase sigma-70 factor, ECF subfamily